LPILWGFALVEEPVALGIGLAIAGTTDTLDGPVARMTGRSSRFGSQLDSVADILIIGSAVAWMAMLRPEFFRAEAASLLIWLGIGLAGLAVTLVRFGRLGDLHLYSAKTAGVVGHIFAIWLFIFGDYHPAFWAVTIGLALVAATETLLMALLRRPDEEWTGSVFLRSRTSR
ncbi:MAG TPA: CDP-alcohol phosphatidyltransferase family protein, partial [Longimicrobiales bacterium]|nr:CDP-alcohol phosphatidyltransferase family protein [Longimicrobiales bacterium]